MSLRRLQRRSAAFLRDGSLLQALRAELAHELSSPPPSPPSPPFSLQTHHGNDNTVGEFAAEWDGPRAQDVFLRRRRAAAAAAAAEESEEEEEEVAVSAVLGPLRFRGKDLPPPPRDALMKVCVKKPHLRPVLRFDCRVFWRRDEIGDSDFSVKDVCYHPSVGSSGDDAFVFSSLNPQLQAALKQYLVSRGVNSELTNFLLQHLQRKEHAQYVNWLRTLESAFAKDA